MGNENEMLAKNIRYLRKINNMKQDELAEKLYVTSQAVSKWETEKSMPDIKLLLSIASLFKVKVEDLLQVDLENKSEELEEEETEEPIEVTQNEETKCTRNVYVLDHSTKNYKVFFVSLITFFALCLVYIPVLFFSFDFVTLLTIFVQAGCLIALIVYQLKISFHLNEITDLYFKTTIRKRSKAFTICMPILMVTLIGIVSLFVFLLPDIKKYIFFYIYLTNL